MTVTPSQLLKTAIQNNQVAQVKEIIKLHGINIINQLDLNNQASLHRACQIGDKETILFLLDNGAQVNAFTKDLKTPLYIAAELGHLAIARTLLKDYSGNVHRERPPQMY